MFSPHSWFCFKCDVLLSALAILLSFSHVAFLHIYYVGKNSFLHHNTSIFKHKGREYSWYKGVSLTISSGKLSMYLKAYSLLLISHHTTAPQTPMVNWVEAVKLLIKYEFHKLDKQKCLVMQMPQTLDSMRGYVEKC